MAKTSDIIRSLCAKRGLSVTNLEKELGFSNGSLTKNNFLRSDRLHTIAQYFNVSMEYMLTGIDAQMADLQGDSMDLLDLFNGMNQEGKEKLLDYARLLASSGEYIKNRQLKVV